MTLIGNVVGDEKIIIEKAKVLASKLKPFPLILSEISFSTTYFQSVFVRIQSTAELMEANLKAKEIYQVDNDVFMPHISLIYGNHSMEKRENIASKILIPKNTFFNAERIVVVPSTQNPDEWKYLSELYIG
jgi:2'-5' RNA ligase